MGKVRPGMWPWQCSFCRRGRFLWFLFPTLLLLHMERSWAGAMADKTRIPDCCAGLGSRGANRDA